MVAAGKPSRAGGFTLLELIIVITIIGILAAIAMPGLKLVPRRASEAALKTDLRTMRDVIDQFYGDNGHYPPSLDALVEEGYLRSIPVDPFTKDEESWQVEYEEIDPDMEPAETDFDESGQPGIMDVHSGSTQMSIDGEPYSEW